MKKLVLQVNVPGESTESGTFSYVSDMYKTSEFFARKYAKKWGAEYHKITDPNELLMNPNVHPAYLRLKVYELEEYDQIFYIDSDYIIKDCAPNIFAIADGKTCVCHNNSDYGREISGRLPVPFARYFNSGMILFDKKDLDKTRESVVGLLSQDWNGLQDDQGLLNTLFFKHEIDFKMLDSHFWNPIEKTFGVYADHYAGPGKQKWDTNRYGINHFV
jgi:hypothetical protein